MTALPYDRFQVTFARAATIALVVGPLAVAALLLALGEPRRLFATLPFSVVGAVGWILLGRANLTLAFRFLVVGVWLCCAHALLWTNGVSAPSVAALAVVILLAGWIAGWRTTATLTVATVLLLFTLAHAEALGAPWPQRVNVTPYQAAFIQSVVMLAAGALGHYATKSLRERIDLLESSEAMFSTAFHSNPVPAMLTRVSDRVLVEVNAAFERTFGYSRAEVVGRRAMSLGLWQDDARRHTIVEDLYGNRPVVEAALGGLHKNGAVLECRMTARFVEIAGDPHVLSNVRDVTEEQAAKHAVERMNAELERRVAERTAELRAAMKELDAFSYSVAHDLNAPLRAINGFASILDEDAAGRLGPSDRAALRRIREGTSRMAELIAGLLKLSRVTRSDLRRERVDLSVLAARIAADRSASEPHRRVEWRIADGLVAQCDRSLAQALLENLLGNAWKYSRKQAEAVIEFGGAPRSDGLSDFFVRDNGAGFDDALAGRIFAPFVRLHRESEFEGHGIGLATAERIVTRHGGAMRAHGEPGRGATFHFTLPTPPPG